VQVFHRWFERNVRVVLKWYDQLCTFETAAGVQGMGGRSAFSTMSYLAKKTVRACLPACVCACVLARGLAKPGSRPAVQLHVHSAAPILANSITAPKHWGESAELA
jgi:hypothetical protein